jgi:hypothetical protein
MNTILGVDRRRIRQLERDRERDVPLTNLTQAENDALHSKPNEENLAYWNTEREKAVTADDVKRILMCDSARRVILLLTVPYASDGELLDDLGYALEKIERLPQEH